MVRAGTGVDDDDEEEFDEEADTDEGVGLTPTGDEVLLAGVGELRGTERRALTANR